MGWYLFGFFDGAPNIIGACIHFAIRLHHCYCLKMGCGQSTNIRSELLALWTLLITSKMSGLPCVHIHGDSSAIINWFNRRSLLSSLTLDGWCQNIRDLESSFLQRDACHVYREYNVMVDGLSKEALSMALGLLHYSEFTEGECTGCGTFQLY